MAKQIAKFVPKQLGITAFLTDSGIDFVIEGPEKPQTRPVWVETNKRTHRKELRLDGKALSVIGYRKDSEGKPAMKLDIEWGDEVMTLGRRKGAAGKVSFYRSLEGSNPNQGPQTDDEIMALLDSLIAK
jgi:hypothetical protein